MMTQNIAAMAQRYTTLFSTHALFLFYSFFFFFNIWNRLDIPMAVGQNMFEKMLYVLLVFNEFLKYVEIILSRKEENERDIHVCRDENM